MHYAFIHAAIAVSSAAAGHSFLLGGVSVMS
jgi:hypothetical protein